MFQKMFDKIQLAPKFERIFHIKKLKIKKKNGAKLFFFFFID